MYNYNKTQDSPYDPTKLAIHSILRLEADLLSNCCYTFEKTVSFDDIVQLIYEENIVTYVGFDCGITFYPEAPTKVAQINIERRNNSRSCEKSRCIPSNDQHYCSIDKEHTSNIFLNPFNLWDMDPPVLSHSTTVMKGTLCPISILNQQLTNLEETYIQCSLPCERWTVRRSDCASALHSFKIITYRTDE